jgi:hypothetical protein
VRSWRRRLILNVTRMSEVSRMGVGGEASRN